MKPNLPPAQSRSRELPPEDFEGKLTWADKRFTKRIKEAADNGLAPKYIGTDEQAPQAAVYSERLKLIVGISDAGAPKDPRIRTAFTYPCTRLADTYRTSIDPSNQVQIISWDTGSAGVDPTSFRALERGQPNPNHEQAIDLLIEIFNDPDAGVVPYEQAFPHDVEHWD